MKSRLLLRMKMKDSGQGLVEAIIIIALIVGALMYAGVIPTPKFTRVTETPAPGSAQEAATAINNMPPTVGPASNGNLPTAIPWNTKIQWGEEALLRTALHEYYATSGFDYRVSTANERGGIGIYCTSGYLQNPFSTYDPNMSIPAQLNSGAITMFPGSRYCAATFVLGELYAGVPQSALQSLDTGFGGQSKANLELTPTTVDPSGATHLTTAPNGDACPQDTVWLRDEEATKTHICGRWVNVRLHVPFGLLTASVQPTNRVKISIDHPNDLVRTFGDMVNWINKEPNIQAFIDSADTKSGWLASYDMIAPIGPNGERDLSNLAQLKADMELHYNSPSSNPLSPYPYDHLRQIAEQQAQAAGYQGVASFSVVLEWPGEPNRWVYLDGIQEGNLRYVVDPNDLAFNVNNIYQLFADEFKAAGTPPAWVPAFARSWFRWP